MARKSIQYNLKQMMKDAIQESRLLLYYCWVHATIRIRTVRWLRSLERQAPVSQISHLKSPSSLIKHSISINQASMCTFRLFRKVDVLNEFLLDSSPKLILKYYTQQRVGCTPWLLLFILLMIKCATFQLNENKYQQDWPLDSLMHLFMTRLVDEGRLYTSKIY